MEENNITKTEDMDESCYIVEPNVELIEINETCDLEIHSKSQEVDAKDGSDNDPESETMGDYQVIDETGFTSNPDENVTENGLSFSEDPVS